jgi:hypothetical protein
MKFAKIGGVLALLMVQWGSSATIVYLDNLNLNAVTSGSAPNAHWILQFKAIPSAGVRRELTRRGVQVLEDVADSALIVSLRQSPDLAGLNIVWTGQLTAADRVAPGLETAAAFLVAFHSDVPKGDAEQLLEGFQILGARGLGSKHFLVAADRGRLPQLAAYDEVSYILPGDSLMAGGPRD